jgi:excisionase family DNA binding protein
MSAGAENGSRRITRATPLEDLPQFVSVEELAAWLGIGRSLAYDLVRRGVVPAVRFGRLVRIPRSALAALVSP